MKEEIKEILLKDFNEILVKEFCTDWKEKRLYIELLVNSTPFSNLLDYITNLQEENERLKADYGTKAQVERDILKEENKKLKQKCDFYHNEFIEEKIKNCKAREYIKDCGYNRWCYGEAEEDLLDILQGKSDE